MGELRGLGWRDIGEWWCFCTTTRGACREGSCSVGNALIRHCGLASGDAGVWATAEESAHPRAAQLRESTTGATPCRGRGLTGSGWWGRSVRRSMCHGVNALTRLHCTHGVEAVHAAWCPRPGCVRRHRCSKCGTVFLIDIRPQVGLRPTLERRLALLRWPSSTTPLLYGHWHAGGPAQQIRFTFGQSPSVDLGHVLMTNGPHGRWALKLCSHTPCVPLSL